MARKRPLYALCAALVAAPLLLGAAPRAQLEQAVAAQRARLAEDARSGGALNDLGNLLVELGELEEAEEAYREAMSVAPERPEPPFNLALLLAATNHPREAQRLLKQLLEQHPDHAWGHYQLGTLIQAKGTRGRAIRHYRTAFRLDTRLTDPHFNPHVLDNSLATAAMLEAFAEEATTMSAQRLYAEPNRVSGLLLPSLTGAPKMDKPEMEEPGMEEPEMEEPEMEEVAVEAPNTAVRQPERPPGGRR